MDRITDFRNVFADVVVSRVGCRDPRIREAFARVPRHEFIGPGPWYMSERGGPTPSDDPAILYHDVAMALVRERGITTGAPSLHAHCIDVCAPKRGERVVHIGTGAGYYTAILAELVGEEGEVRGIEIDAELAAKASSNLKPWPWARVEAASGTDSTIGTADLIYVCAGVVEPPQAWLTALSSKGRLAFPLTPLREEGAIFLVRNVGSPHVFAAEFVSRARFIPCIGAQDDEASARLRDAFRRGDHESVRSFRLRPEEPDESAWFSSRGWWLSTREA